jgi:hypothetical protein
MAAPMSAHTGHRTRRARGAPGEHPQSSDEQNRDDGGLDGIAESGSQRRPPAHRWRGRRRAGPENVATIGRESNWYLWTMSALVNTRSPVQRG